MVIPSWLNENETVTRESENSGLDHWTGQWTLWEEHTCNNPAGFVSRVMEPKFKYFGFRGRVPRQSCEYRGLQ